QLGVSALCPPSQCYCHSPSPTWACLLGSPGSGRGRFLLQFKFDCHYTNGTERVRLLVRNLYDRQQFVQFDSDLGVYVGETEVGRRWAEGWNKNQAHLAARRAEVDTVCRHNYGVVERFLIHRRVQPKVRVSPTKSGSQPHPHLLVCSVTGFYPGGIEIKWLKNGQEQTAGVVSTELLQNGDWTFQILVMLEMSPRRGDVYTCQVEHISLRGPLAVHWEAQSDSARSKMLTGVGGFVLGLIFLGYHTSSFSRTCPAFRHSNPRPGGIAKKPNMSGKMAALLLP
uniref:Ig-like domain-containing protein n=1 Tax=Terrapene triunguis TaxID=2587831 RepID=A0A674JCT9_9SAUR